MSNERKSIEEMTADTEKPVRDRKNWVAFVESDAVNFMTLNEMEKMTPTATGNPTSYGARTAACWWSALLPTCCKRDCF